MSMDKMMVAMARGEKDGANYARLVASGERGAQQRDKYASNPYNASAEPMLWAAYNAAFSAQQATP